MKESKDYLLSEEEKFIKQFLNIGQDTEEESNSYFSKSKL